MQWVTLLGELLPKYKNAMVKSYEMRGTGEFNTEWEEVGTGIFWSRGANAGLEKTKKVRVPTTEKMKRVCIGEKPSSAITKLRGSGLKFFYAQILMGDAADNYKGLPDCGMTGAYNLLANCRDEKELYLTVLKAYKGVYGTGVHWCPHFKGTEEYADAYIEVHGTLPLDWVQWKNRGAWLTAYDRMLEQGRLAWMQTYQGDVWRKDKGRIIDANDKTFWRYQDGPVD